ncbi:MAG: hypothetical protein AB9922_12240 [Bacteroidales bacterium]
MKAGDNVKIVPKDDHLEHVKKYYDETLKIQKVVVTGLGLFFKISGIKNFARESDLKPNN